ncbi:MAG: AAA family ATPase [Microcoleaceae cyanobacterium]
MTTSNLRSNSSSGSLHPRELLPTLVQQMLRPEFYPHSVKTPIQLCQTHISFIFLTGDFAYKIKKSVNLGFLDFSTIEKRQYFCNQELRMNQALAPNLYLEVLPITQQNNKFSFGNDSNHIVEYALKMRQFPQEDLLINRFKNNQITLQQIEELGQVVAKFHLAAPTNDDILKLGQVENIRHSINQNFEQAEKYIGIAQTQKQYDETKQFSQHFFEQRQALFNQRINNHWIRECHGDLHLKNICIFEDKITLFDRIEFNQEFRFVDVMYDVAFLVMDLEARGRTDLSYQFLNTYIEITGDWEGLQILPFYLSRQAYVRAKVNSIMLDDTTISEEDKIAIIQDAKHYYQLAWQYTQQQHGGMIIMSGLSGSGKSTIARKLSQFMGAIQIRTDAVRKHLGGISLHEKGGDELYTSEMTQKTYSRLLELGILLIKAGFWVILDGKYDRINLRKKVINLCNSQQLSLHIVECNAPLEILRSRLQNRQNDIADATADLLTSQQALAEAFTPEEQPYLTTIDTTQNVDNQLKCFINKIKG